MKITKQGEIPKPKVPIWVGLKVSCANCDTEFILEQSDWDKVILHQARQFLSLNNLGKRPYIKVDCPVCREKLIRFIE
jgi:ssDNA-binding Zn-finger/Zn-ribbon topoisomerase 1